MPWLQATVECARSAAEPIEDALLHAGAVSVTLLDAKDQPILEPGIGETPLWDAVQLLALFEAEISTSFAERLFQEALEAPPALRWEVLEDREWSREWMQHFEPIQCGDRLWICPSWKAPPNPDAVNLLLDPGLAFGTGTHPTTFLCLQWLDSQPLAGKTVLDYGCGSGILGIAALLLGATRVIAVDNDPQALIATEDNLRRNRLDPALLQTCLPDALPAIDADITVANILAEPLIALAPRIISHTAVGGALCMSGILQQQADIVADAYRTQCNFSAAAQREEWVRLNAIRQH